MRKSVEGRRDLWGELAPWLQLLARRRGRLAAGTGLMAVTLLSAIGLLALSGWFITATGLTGMLLAAGVAARLDVYLPGGGIRAFAVTRTVARYLERLYNHDTVLRLLADLRGRLFGMIAALDAHALRERRASDWLNRLTADIDTLDSLFLRLLAPAVVSLLAILGLGGFLALWAPMAGLVVGGVLLIGWGWLVVGQARLGMAASRRQITTRESLRGRLVEQMQGMAELEAYGALAHHRQRIEALEAELYRDQRWLGTLVALGNALVAVLVGGTALTALWLAATAWQADMLSGPVAVMMPLAVLAMNEALTGLPAAFTWLGATRGAARRLNGLRRAASRPPAVKSGRAARPGPLSVSIDRVSLHYPGAPLAALEGLTLKLAAGERLALCGVSGAGKSSVAGLLLRQLTPSAGEIQLGGVALDAWPEASLRRRVAALTQHIDLLDDSLAANLRLARPEAEEGALWAALAWVELADWALTLPAGLDTRVGEGGRRLSGGQARRLALARLYLLDPDLVLLDEPFASLDAATVARLSPRLDAWLEGRTTIYLVHQLDGGDFDPPGIDHRLILVEGQVNLYKESI
ncbi:MULTISPECIES: thiol reductant ABC exporter subunit CydC [unclassified Halomonas]|uniref:thiol reductant ABC exporter subunit CydC n=1 Tax=unclassified Halomonas TaxID=2609666 RepID=UPI0028871C64|nr:MULTISPECIES: thiol reductant ABC exporter subunit CydC [unclassified Halomonas]MDT0499638.1 thiol reductant ABC exporter subunit CydC [Halomonas sp. PAR7]MDT0510545.1 thiol reductant ABC exporter subunit CydC [Halomonas sp. LES1]MDT0592656.1 thiol reductant ABC exporter subunit CydC [Halomonas sp. PAR8]